MTNHSPTLENLTGIEEQALVGRLEAIRQVISHAGEKGRALEGEVLSLLRDFLPGEYGLSTGFVVYHTPLGPRLSSQLDIVIYDAIRSGPIARLGSCDVFPLEAVYAYIEVKATLQSTSDDAVNGYASNSIESCILNNKELRAMNERRYYVPKAGTTNLAELKIKNDCIPIRGYVFAFEIDTAKTPCEFAERISEFSRNTRDVHLHGIFIGGSAFYQTLAVDDPETTRQEDFYHVQYTEQHCLSAFKWCLLHDLSRYPRHPSNHTPAIDAYNVTRPDWYEYPAPDCYEEDNLGLSTATSSAED